MGGPLEGPTAAVADSATRRYASATHRMQPSVSLTHSVLPLLFVRSLFCSVIGSLHNVTWGQYCEDDLTGMVVRGINFMSDKKKVDCTPPIFKLMHLDLFKTKKEEERCAHYAASKDSWAAQRWERLQAKRAALAAAAGASGSDASASAGA